MSGGGGTPKLSRMVASALTAPSLIFFAFLATAAALALYVLRGPELFADTLTADLRLIGVVLPRLVGAALVAGFVRVLVPAELISRWVGSRSGLRGLIAATLAGTVSLGGPITVFALAATLRLSGADRGALVAYITSWALLGVNRILIWEIPLMGVDFALLRLAVSAALPVLAGLLARALPFDLDHPARA